MRTLAIGLVGIACCLGAETASADTFCVAPDTSCTPAANNKATIQDALATAAGNGNLKDTIKLGATTYSNGPFTDGSGNPVDIVGAGTSQTVLTAPSGNNQFVLNLGDSASTITGSAIVVPSGNNNTGLSLAGSATGLAITGPSATTPVGVFLNQSSSSFSAGSISLPSTSSNHSTGVSAMAGTITDSTVTATTGFADGIAVAGPTVKRTQIFAHAGVSGAATIEDSQLTVKALGASPATGLSVSASFITPSATLIARHDTIVGDGGGGSVGASVTSSGSMSSTATASLTVNDSIVRGFATDFARSGTTANACGLIICDGTANLSFDYDDYGGVITDNAAGPGPVTDGGHNKIGVDPHFVAEGASPPDYHLRFDSPLIDAGMANPESGPPAESTQDADGNSRKVGAATDIGAYEYQRRPPVPSASVTPTSAQIGSPFTFTGSATDPDPGDAVSLTWSFDDGATGSGSQVTHAFATSGTHTATLTATDSAGVSASKQVTVSVTAPGGGGGGGGGGGQTAPVLRKLKLTPTAFRAARTGPSVAAVRTGTRISYTVSMASVTTFRVERAVPGVKRGKRCVKPTRRTRRGKRCTRFVFVRGRFTHTNTAGLNSFRFTGRIGGVTLKPGNYRLDATPQAAGHIGQVVRSQFHIIPPPKKRGR